MGAKLTERGNDLYERAITYDYGDQERADIMRKVWSVTPFMVDAFTDSINSERERDIRDWCRENIGAQAHPIHGHEGEWQLGSVTIHGWTWVGFAKEEQLAAFLRAFPPPADRLAPPRSPPMRRAEIIERLEKADGPDRDLDLEIGFAVDGWRFEMVEGSDREMVYVPCDKTYYANHPGGMYPSFTDSLDATTALAERTLPGWARLLIRIEGIEAREHICEAELWLPAQRSHGLPCERFRAGAQTEPNALLIALFRALEAKETGNG